MCKFLPDMDGDALCCRVALFRQRVLGGIERGDNGVPHIPVQAPAKTFRNPRCFERPLNVLLGDISDASARAERDSHLEVDLRIDGCACDVVQRGEFSATPCGVKQQGVVFQMVVAVPYEVVKEHCLQKQSSIAKGIG